MILIELLKLKGNPVSLTLLLILGTEYLAPGSSPYLARFCNHSMPYSQASVLAVLAGKLANCHLPTFLRFACLFLECSMTCQSVHELSVISDKSWKSMKWSS